MDFLGSLLNIIGQHPGSQQPAVNRAQLPNPNQVPLGGSFMPYGHQSPLSIQNIDKPASSPSYGGKAPTGVNVFGIMPTPAFNVYTGPRTGQRTYDDDNNPTSPVLPFNPQPGRVDANQTINTKQVFNASPAKLAPNFLQMLSQGVTHRA